jgi:hypothetical protein
MTLEQNITAILESYFSGFKDELIEACVQRIMKQIERQADTPQTDSTGSPIGDYRDGVGAWQTDCGWGEPK